MHFADPPIGFDEIIILKEIERAKDNYLNCHRLQAAEHGIRLEVVTLAAAKKGFVLLSRRRVVRRSFEWSARFRRLARDYERLPETLAGRHFPAFARLMRKRFVEAMS